MRHTSSLLVWTLFAIALPTATVAQPLVRRTDAGGGTTLVALVPADGGTSRLATFGIDGAQIASWPLPFAAGALCLHAGGTVVAPADGGLALVDAAGQVKTRVPGMVYDALVCTGSHVYAAGRTLRVHRFGLPTLKDATTVLEANSWITRLLSPKEGLLAAASWDGGVWLLSQADRQLRTLPGKGSLLDLAVGPGDTWITLSDEGQILTLRDTGAQVHRFKASGARSLAVGASGTLALIVGTNSVVLYRQAGVRWLETRRLKLESPALPGSPVPLTAGRWAVLTAAGPFLFGDTP